MSRLNFQAACPFCDEAVDRRDLASHIVNNHPEKENVDPVLAVPIAVDLAGKSLSADVDDSQVSGAENLDAAAIESNHTSLLELRNPIAAEDAVCDGLAAFVACLKQKWSSHDVDSDLYAENAVSTNVVSTSQLFALLDDDHVVSTIQLKADLAGADQASLKRADFALLAGAALKLKNIVDPLMQIDPKAENDYTGHMKWLKRAQLTLRPDECSSSAALVEQALPIVSPGAVVSETRASYDLARQWCLPVRASPRADVPAAVDLADHQFLTYYVASGEWLKRAVFALTNSVVASTVTDRQVIVESRPVSAEVARQWWLEEAGMCMVASIACLLKWKEALDAGVVESSNVGLASELGGEEELEPQDMSLEILNAITELRVKEDVLASLEAAEEESAKRNDKDDDF